MSDADLYMRIEKTCDRIAEARGDVRNKLMTGLSKEKKLAAEAVLREYGTGKVCSHFDGKLCAENEELKRFFFWQFDEINGNNKLIDFYAMTILDAPEIKAAAKILAVLRRMRLFAMLCLRTKKQSLISERAKWQPLHYGLCHGMTYSHLKVMT